MVEFLLRILMSDKEKTTGVWLFDMAASLSLIGALIYTTGWTYAYYYFEHFGLGLLDLDIPNQYFLMYGFWVYKAWWWLMVALYVLALFLLLKLQGWRKDERSTVMLAKQAQISLVLLVFIIGAWLAYKYANDYYVTQQAQTFSAFPHVRVWPKKVVSDDRSLTQFYTELPNGNYRLLLQSKKHIYLIKPPRDGRPARLAVSIIPLAYIEALRLLP